MERCGLQKASVQVEVECSHPVLSVKDLLKAYLFSGPRVEWGTRSLGGVNTAYAERQIATIVVPEELVVLWQRAQTTSQAEQDELRDFMQNQPRFQNQVLGSIRFRIGHELAHIKHRDDIRLLHMRVGNLVACGLLLSGLLGLDRLLQRARSPLLRSRHARAVVAGLSGLAGLAVIASGYNHVHQRLETEADVDAALALHVAGEGAEWFRDVHDCMHGEESEGEGEHASVRARLGEVVWGFVSCHPSSLSRAELLESL